MTSSPPPHGVIDVYLLAPMDAVKPGTAVWTAQRANTLIAERNALIAEVAKLSAEVEELRTVCGLWR